MLVRIGTLTRGLLNENDTNGIKTDSIRSFVNTHCLRLVLEIKSFYTFSSLDNLKASFHCSHLSKKFQIFTTGHKSNVLNSAAKLLLSNLSPNLSAYQRHHHNKEHTEVEKQSILSYPLIIIRCLRFYLFATFEFSYFKIS